MDYIKLAFHACYEDQATRQALREIAIPRLREESYKLAAARQHLDTPELADEWSAAGLLTEEMSLWQAADIIERKLLNKNK